MNDKEIIYLQLEDIIPNRFQPREVFDEKSLKELAVSIKEHGVIQPIIVRKVDDKYEIIAGERRYKAAGLARLSKIPAIVRDLDDKEAAKVALLENLQRKNLNPMEEAHTYQKILDLDNITQEELAQNMGKSQSAVANKIRLLSLPKEVQDALINEQISERHARSLLNLKNEEDQKALLNKIIENKMTVRELENEIKKINEGNNVDNIDEENLPEVPIEEPTPAPDILKENIPTIEDIKPENEDINLGINNYINQDVITPTVEEEKTTKEYGEVTVAPPEEEQQPKTNVNSNLPKFINYGEINDEDDNDDSETTKNLSTSTSIDIDDLKLNANDINPEENKKAVDLDGLLKVNPQVPTIDEEVKEDSSFKFIKPEEEQPEKVEEQPSTDNFMDYFVSPDIIPTVDNKPAIDKPATDEEAAFDQVLNSTPVEETKPKEKFDENGDFIVDEDENLPEAPTEESKEKPYIYIPDSIKDKAALTSILMSDGVKPREAERVEAISLKDAINEIRKTINNLEKRNIYIESEEVDLPNNYQINIKIRKDDE